MTISSSCARVLTVLIVDQDTKTMGIYELAGDEYRSIGEYGGESTFEPALFSGLTINLAELWE